MAERIQGLLEAGWEQVTVVTDHGWLLLPGGLPKAEMPSYLAESRWGRCAVLKSGSKVEVPTVAWHWSEDIRVAMAPGISCFKAGMDYAHGSLSLQECLVPEIVVRASKVTKPSVTIQTVKWTGLRCRVEVTGATAGLAADLRTKTGDPNTSVTNAQGVGDDGAVSLLVTDDSLQGTAALVVLLLNGTPVAKHPTTIGE